MIAIMARGLKARSSGSPIQVRLMAQALLLTSLSSPQDPEEDASGQLVEAGLLPTSSSSPQAWVPALIEVMPVTTVLLLLLQQAFLRA